VIENAHLEFRDVLTQSKNADRKTLEDVIPDDPFAKLVQRDGGRALCRVRKSRKDRFRATSVSFDCFLII